MTGSLARGEPVRSMTGSGSFAVDAGVGRVEAEARSVNHRFLKTTLRAHGPVPNVESAVEDCARRVAQRGHVTVTLRYVPAAGDGTATPIDEAAFASAAARLKSLARAHGLPPVGAADVLAVPGVVLERGAGGDDEAVLATCVRAVEGALKALVASREREGALLVRELLGLLSRVEKSAGILESRAPEVPAAWQARLLSRLEELLASAHVAPDPAQVAREVALMADRSDVREEVARLSAHVEHGRQILEEGGPVGRRLDFLIQEMHREANTIGSKTGDLDLVRTVMELKADVERLREQVQNLE